MHKSKHIKKWETKYLIQKGKSHNSPYRKYGTGKTLRHRIQRNDCKYVKHLKEHKDRRGK